MREYPRIRIHIFCGTISDWSFKTGVNIVQESSHLENVDLNYSDMSPEDRENPELSPVDVKWWALTLCSFTHLFSDCIELQARNSGFEILTFHHKGVGMKST